MPQTLCCWMILMFITKCYGQTGTGTVRLVGGQNAREGRVEVYYSGTWGSVCDDSWDDNDARVICRQLGFATDGARAHRSGRFGQGSGDIFLNNVQCSGSEKYLSGCPHTGWRFGNCADYGDAGVTCGNLGTNAVRLVGGTNAQEGRVEIYYNGLWGSVCDYLWDDDDAEVVCRQLGLPTDDARAHGWAHFGRGSGTIFLDEVECSGFEDYLGQCRHAGWGVENCVRDEEAGVSCDTSEDLWSSETWGSSIGVIGIIIVVAVVVGFVLCLIGTIIRVVRIRTRISSANSAYTGTHLVLNTSTMQESTNQGLVLVNPQPPVYPAVYPGPVNPQALTDQGLLSTQPTECQGSGNPQPSTDQARDQGVVCPQPPVYPEPGNPQALTDQWVVYPQPPMCQESVNPSSSTDQGVVSPQPHVYPGQVNPQTSTDHGVFPQQTACHGLEDTLESIYEVPMSLENSTNDDPGAHKI